MGFPDGTSGKEPACQYRRPERYRFNPWVGKNPWRKAWQLTPVFLLGESHGQRSPTLGLRSVGVTKSQTQLKHLTRACIRCNAVNHSEGEGGQWGHLCIESMYMSPLHTVPDTLWMLNERFMPWMDVCWVFPTLQTQGQFLGEIAVTRHSPCAQEGSESVGDTQKPRGNWGQALP